MARDDEFGRMVVANRDLAVGDLVIEVRLMSCHIYKDISTCCWRVESLNLFRSVLSAGHLCLTLLQSAWLVLAFFKRKVTGVRSGIGFEPITKK